MLRVPLVASTGRPGYSMELLVALVVTPRQVWRSPLVACLAAKPVDRRNGLVRLSPVGAKVQIRPGSDAELPALVEALGERPFFADRLARQHKGRGVLLGAWLGDRPVGDVYLMREPADVPKVRRYLFTRRPTMPSRHDVDQMWTRNCESADGRLAETL